MTPWLICGFTILVVLILDRLESKYVKSLLDWFPAILFAYIIPAIITEVGNFDFSEHAIHSFSKTYIIPMAILTVMSSLSIRQLKGMGWKPILVFLSGSLWIALFPVAFIALFWGSDLVNNTFQQGDYWKGIPPIIGSWIGGSTSQLVLKELVSCPEGLFLNILIIDNILVNIWTILMFQSIKKTNFFNSKFKITSDQTPVDLPKSSENALPFWWVLIFLVTSVLIVNVLVEQLITKIILLSIIGLLLSNSIKKWAFEFVLQLGSILIITVMAILGLKLRFDLIQMDVPFLLFLIIWLTGHFIFMLFVAKLLNISMVWVPIASMANVGGIATAPAVTAAYEKKWMPHAIILAVLSMATGTFWGMWTIFLLKLYFEL